MRELLIEGPPVLRRLDAAVRIVDPRHDRVDDPALPIPRIEQRFGDIHVRIVLARRSRSSAL
jgi:hypothetical protein